MKRITDTRNQKEEIFIETDCTGTWFRTSKHYCIFYWMYFMINEML